MILNMASGKVPMTYRGTKTVVLFHFDEPHGSTTVTPTVGRGTTTLTSACSVTNNVYKWNGSLIIPRTTTVQNFKYVDTNYSIGTGPFTVEYFSTLSTLSSIGFPFYILFYDGVSIDSSPLTIYSLYYNGGSGTYYTEDVRIYQYGSSKLSGNDPTSRNYADFCHWAIVGDGGASGNRHIAWFFNGSRKFYVSIDYNLPGSLVTTFYTPTSSQSSYIYMDELRISNIARYSGTSLTVPSAPFTPD